MVDRSEFTEGFQPVGQLRVRFTHALQRVGAGREAAIVIGAGYNGVDVAVHQLIGSGQHIDNRQTGLALSDPGLNIRIQCFVIDNGLAAGVTVNTWYNT